MAENRKIFEDVGASARAPAPSAAPTKPDARRNNRMLRVWLLCLMALVGLMIVVGGLTRLTDSGLSITEWQPIAGALPPMNEAAWTDAFEKYQAIPEFRIQNREMSLAGFKAIYWWEWSHRQLGRLIGLVWAMGFFWFLLRRQIPIGWTGRLALLGGLGGLQGALGWWMVSSGLTGRMVDVASYRLALHLGLAFVILGLITWFLLSLARGAREMLQDRRNRDTGLARGLNVLGALVFFQVLLGALVAGIDAGRGYTDWPLMNGQVLPSESFDYAPFWSNFFENPALVQFNHRLIGYVVAILMFVIWRQSRKSPVVALRRAVGILALWVVVQMLLGISTVQSAAAWQIAILHQIGAIGLMILILRARFAAMYPPAQALR